MATSPPGPEVRPCLPAALLPTSSTAGSAEPAGHCRALTKALGTLSSHRWEEEAAGVEKINVEELLDPASVPHARQNRAGQREGVCLFSLFAQRHALSGKHSLCDATQKSLAPGDLHSQASTLGCSRARWMPALAPASNSRMSDLFLFSLGPFCCSRATFPLQLLR